MNNQPLSAAVMKKKFSPKSGINPGKGSLIIISG
jgi:hypothetical protein